MADQTFYWTADTGQTLYVMPLSQSLTNWATYRVQLVELAGDDTGKYWATLDDGEVWALFVGSAQPSSWADAIATITLTPAAPNPPSASQNADAVVTALINTDQGTVGSWESGSPLALIGSDAASVSARLTGERAAKLDNVAQASDLAGISGGGPLLQEKASKVVRLGTRSDGVFVANQKVRMVPGESFLVAIDCQRATRREPLEAVGVPESSNAAVATVDATEGAYGVSGDLVKVKVTAVAEGSSRVKATVAYSGGQSLVGAFDVEVSAAL